MGLLIAAGLVLLIVLLLNARSKQEARLREARQQTADILRTVKDGLFLIDENLVIGTAYSGALEMMFQRKDLAGLGFEDLLKGIVSEKTLATALKFVKVLWAERTNEKLVKSINPLGEVEVHLAMGHGKFDTRYLDFEFHRVRVDGKITHVLVSVSDVSSRVELARELQNSQQQAQAQVDTLLGILHIDPGAPGLVPQRFECGHEDDQRRAPGAGPRGGRLSQEARHPVQAGSFGQGRGGGARPVLDRKPRPFLRGRSQGVAREAGPVGQRFPAARHQARRLADPLAIGERAGVATIEIPAVPQRGACAGRGSPRGRTSPRR